MAAHERALATHDAEQQPSSWLPSISGAITIDNTLWDGAVIDESDQSENTLAIRALNEKIRQDDRVDFALTTIGDGLTICIPR